MEVFYDNNFTEYVWQPLMSACVQIAVSFGLNFCFAKFVYKTPLFIFNQLAFLFGLCQLLFAASKDAVIFTFITIMLHTLFFYVAMKLNQLLCYNHHNILKLYLIIYASSCFKIYQWNNLEELVIILITLNIKLLCAAKNGQGEGLSGSISDLFILMAYLTYTPWMSFTAFVTLRRKQHKKTEEWFLRMFEAVPQALFFKLLSHKIISDCFIESEIINSIVTSITRGFQYRSKYYFQGQLAEIELLAAGVRQFNWTKHLTFNFEEVECSVLIINAVGGINTPLADFFYNNFIVKNNDKRKISALVHILLFLLVIFINSARHSVLFMVFLGSLYFQERAIAALQRFFDICLYSCPSPVCYHWLGPRDEYYCCLKLALILNNHFRMSVLFVNSETVFSSITCTLTFISIDIAIIICFQQWFKEQVSYFRYALCPY